MIKYNKLILGVDIFNYCLNSEINSHKEREEFENKQPVYALLCDEKVILKCKNFKELHNNKVDNYKFDVNCYDSPRELEDYVSYLKDKYQLKEVSIDEFKRIENAREEVM